MFESNSYVCLLLSPCSNQIIMLTYRYYAKEMCFTTWLQQMSAYSTGCNSTIVCTKL